MELQPKISFNTLDSVTGRQLRAARALLGWTALDLAKASDVSVATIRRAELREAAEVGVSAPISKAIVAAFQEVGVLFLDGEDGLGVRMVRN